MGLTFILWNLLKKIQINILNYGLSHYVWVAGCMDFFHSISLSFNKGDKLLSDPAKSTGTFHLDISWYLVKNPAYG